MSQVYHKKGDTFTLICVWKDALGVPVDLSTYSIASQVRSTKFVDNLSVTVIDAANGKFSVSRSAADTSSWPVSNSVSRVFCDIQFTKGSIVTSSETFEVIVLEDITQ